MPSFRVSVVARDQEFVALGDVLIAARLALDAARGDAEVGGGGKAFRYGGEEFAVLFPGTELEDALLYLETIRISIEGYRMAVRAPDRPKAAEDGSKRRGAGDYSAGTGPGSGEGSSGNGASSGDGKAAEKPAAATSGSSGGKTVGLDKV